MIEKVPELQWAQHHDRAALPILRCPCPACEGHCPLGLGFGETLYQIEQCRVANFVGSSKGCGKLLKGTCDVAERTAGVVKRQAWATRSRRQAAWRQRR